jgi:DNA-binding phage protein
MRVLEERDVVSLLRSEIERAGSLGLWAEKTGVHRSVVSKVLSNVYPPTKSIIKALKLRTVFVADSK